MTRLSIMMPIHNPNLLILRKAIRAIVVQSLKDWELIAVMDGEDKAAETVVRSEMKHCPNRFKIVTIPHSGVQRARNAAREHAGGEFLLWLDCDCIIEPDTAQTWVDQFAKHPDVAFVYSGYKFIDEKGAIQSEPFDPWTLRVRNYISTCFPVRASFAGTWDESLKSLQDWNFWLDVVDKGGKGKFLPGFAFSTLYPEEKSISGQGCSDSNWLSRVDAVKRLHNIPERDVCVSSLANKHEGVWLAKLIEADYQDYPNWKPHRYKTIIQIGFSLLPHAVQAHTSIFNERHVKKVLFWTCDDITELYSRLNYLAIKKYRVLLNSMVNLKQYVEDKCAYDMMKELGFEVEIKQLPMAVEDAAPLPEKPRFAVDINGNYGPVLNVLEISLPDVELVNINGAAKLSEFTGLIHLHPDRTTSNGMKRAWLAGRHVISNVQAPFAGYVDDTKDLAQFIPEVVEAIREAAKTPQMLAARDYYAKMANAKTFAEAL